MHTKVTDGILGTFSIDQNGDTSLTDYGIFSLKGGQVKFEKVIKSNPTG
jgi:branched-chain amino acid transport system substrate-binding protein